MNSFPLVRNTLKKQKPCTIISRLVHSLFLSLSTPLSLSFTLLSPSHSLSLSFTLSPSLSTSQSHKTRQRFLIKPRVKHIACMKAIPGRVEESTAFADSANRQLETSWVESYVPAKPQRRHPRRLSAHVGSHRRPHSAPMALHRRRSVGNGEPTSPDRHYHSKDTRPAGTTVFSRVSAHLRVSAHPLFLMILPMVCVYIVYVQMASPCKRPPPFFGRKFQTPMGAYSGDYGKRILQACAFYVYSKTCLYRSGHLDGPIFSGYYK